MWSKSCKEVAVMGKAIIKKNHEIIIHVSSNILEKSI